VTRPAAQTTSAQTTSAQTTSAKTTATQTTDWADPAALAALSRIHTFHAWRSRRLPLLALGLLVVIGVFQWSSTGNPVFLIAAVALGGLMLLVHQFTLTRVRRAALASGVTTYRLGDALHIQNALGSFDLPLTEINRIRTAPDGILITYARTSTLTLLSGPIRTEFERRLSIPPGGTP
jgi:hypothetical protein